MRQTALMGSGGEPAIRVPAVADDHVGEVLAEQIGGLRIAASGLDLVDGRLGGCHDPQPVEPAGDLPAGFVGRDDGTVADLVLQGRIGRLRVPAGPVDGADQSAAADRDAVVLSQQGRHLAERQPQLLVENDRPGHQLRAELHPGRPERIGTLQPMPALHPAPARPAGANRHLELTDDTRGTGNSSCTWVATPVGCSTPPQSGQSGGSGT